MPRSIKFGNALLCDHATMGANNKHTLVNVYSGDVFVGQKFPATFPLSAYIEHLPDQNGAMVLKLSLRLDDEPLLVIEADASGMQKGKVGVISIPPFPITFQKAGTLTLTAEADGYQPTTILKKRVIEGLPTA